MQNSEIKKTYEFNLKNIIISIFTLVILNIYILSLYNGNLSTLGLLIVLSSIIIVMPIIVTNDLFHPFILFSISIILAVIDFLNKDIIGNYSYIDNRYRNQAFILIIVWYIFFYAGYIISLRIKKSNKRLLLNNKLKNPLLVAALLFGMSLSAFGYTLVQMGGINGMLSAMETTTTSYSGLGYLRLIVGLGGVSSLIYLSERKIKYSVIVLVITSILLTFFGGRANVVLGTILPYIITYHYTVKKLSLIKLLPFGMFGLIFVEIIGVLRKVSETNFSFSGLSQTIVNAASATGRATTIPMLVEGLESGNIDFQKLKPMLNIFYAPIPRNLWQGKPDIIDSSVLVAYELTGSKAYGMPAGPYGEAYFYFGWFGIMILGMITGYTVATIYKKMVLNNQISSDVFSLKIIFYSLIVQSLFSIITIGSQIKVVWYIGVFIFIYFVDVLLEKMIVGK